MKQPDYTFGGRIRPQEDKETNWANLVELDNEGKAFVYQRLSTHEQVRRHTYSIKAQDALADLARDDGYSEDQIYVEKRDLGISGTKGREEREGLAHLIDCIERDTVESIYVVHISRLFRDQTLIDALAFGELCKEHGVIIVTPQMRLNLRDKMHMRLYRMEVERAADELELMQSRLGAAREIKARQGHYTGGSIPAGYVLDTERRIEVDGRLVDNPNYHKYVVYEPHAEIVRKLFQMARLPGTTVPQIVRQCQNEGLAFPPYPKELAKTKPNSVAFAQSRKHPDGSWQIAPSRVRSILRNPAYIGWWIWNHELIKTDNHPSIIDEETFWAVQELWDDHPHRPKKDHPPLPLSGLLYCGDHDIPRRMIYSHGTRTNKNLTTYQCRNDLYNTHCNIRAQYLDGPIGEAVISQCAYPELADQVLERLAREYESAKTQAAASRREHERLTREIENLEHNFANARLTPQRAAKIEAQIQERLTRLKELSNLQNTQVGKLVGPAVTQDDVELVKRFLSNLEDGWKAQPPDLKNAFLRLVLEQVIIWHSRALIRVRIIWRTGLEQELVIHRPYREPFQYWTEDEVEVMRAHFEATPHDELMSLLPNRTWRQIRAKGERLGLNRRIHGKKPGGGRRYAPWEEEVLRQHYRGELSMTETLARLDNRTEDSVRCKMKNMDLKRDFDVKPEWEWVEDSNLSTIEHPSVLAES